MLKRSFQFNFPAIKEEKMAAEDKQAKLHEELAEIDEALSDLKTAVLDCATLPTLYSHDDVAEAEDHLLEEVLDLYHATETVLRAFPADKVFAMRNKVIEKNEMRGYYGD